MIAIPAVDLREGACVQLVGGSYAREAVRIADPLEAARRWTNAGFRRLHIVDLDAATGVGDNRATVARLIAESGVDVQVGGGVRSTERVKELMDAGATSVVVGTRAVENPVWLAEISGEWPGRVIVAADVRERTVATHGWSRAAALDVGDFVRSLASLPLAGILVTAVHREGLMQGTDRELMSQLVDIAKVPLIASGGIATMDDLRSLSTAGISAAVLGMSLYTGALDPRVVAEEFGK